MRSEGGRRNISPQLFSGIVQSESQYGQEMQQPHNADLTTAPWLRRDTEHQQPYDCKNVITE